MSVLSVKNLAVSINNTELIKDVSFAIHPGEILALVGPNGAGKTTLLKAITDEIATASGSIFINNHALVKWEKQKLAKHLAVLPQFSLLNFPYTVEEVVALGRIPHSTGVAVDKTIVQEAMTELDITYLMGRHYTTLSGGEKQRTQLARVLTQIWRNEDANPRLLLLDEPSTALDLGHQQQLMAIIRRFAGQGVAVAMILHDINIAIKYADKILALSCGRALAYGSSKSIINKSLLLDLFGANVQLVNNPETGNPVVIL